MLGKLWPLCQGRCKDFLEQGLFSDMSVLCLLAFSLHAVTGKSAGGVCELFFIVWGCSAAAGHGVGAYGKVDSQRVLSSPITSRAIGTID